MSKPDLGIIGGGQLGSLLASAAKKLNIKTIILSDDKDAPAINFADEFIYGDYQDINIINNFLEKVDLVTYEFENIPYDILKKINETKSVLPSPEINKLIQNRMTEKEFLNKRIQLYEILWSYDYKAPKAFFIDLDYNTEFDDFLLNQVGYDKLALLMQGVFISPYAATSLREYFATGFTDFFMNKSRDDLKSVSPVLYSKLRSLSLDDFDK